MIKIIICPPREFELRLEQWFEQQDEAFPDHMTDYEIIKITDFDLNYDVAHYIKYSLILCEDYDIQESIK